MFRRSKINSKYDYENDTSGSEGVCDIKRLEEHEKQISFKTIPKDFL